MYESKTECCVQYTKVRQCGRIECNKVRECGRELKLQRVWWFSKA